MKYISVLLAVSIVILMSCAKECEICTAEFIKENYSGKFDKYPQKLILTDVNGQEISSKDCNNDKQICKYLQCGI